ncbi:hypothetical protein ACDY97_16150 [Rhizobium mongolense]|uniref:hypothetical protein n=1 Tax=Rhizobium mongolense TaxID=57676 RepID=UPI003558167B
MTNRAIIGRGDRIVDAASSTVLRFEPAEIVFRPIASYLTALHGFFGLTEIYNNDGKGAQPWSHDDVAIFDGAASDVRLVWSPHETVWPMTINAWPPKIDFIVYNAEPIPTGSALTLGVLEQYTYGLGQALITNFYENQRASLKAQYGSVRHWPAVWDFARVVRNAMSHGGKISIDDDTRVSWNGLHYCASDNGRAIINRDLWPADLFILLKDLEAALPAIL